MFKQKQTTKLIIQFIWILKKYSFCVISYISTTLYIICIYSVVGGLDLKRVKGIPKSFYVKRHDKFRLSCLLKHTGLFKTTSTGKKYFNFHNSKVLV